MGKLQTSYYLQDLIVNLYAATDGPHRAPHGPARDHAANALDRQSRKDRDFDDLVDSAMQRRASSQKALVPSKSKKNMQEVDLNKLTRSKRNLVIEQVLEVWRHSLLSMTCGIHRHCLPGNALLKGTHELHSHPCLTLAHSSANVPAEQRC